jgi:hypothetical protein
MCLKCRSCGTEWRLGEADVDNPPDAEQRARARALKEDVEAIRKAAAMAEVDWRYSREREAEGVEESSQKDRSKNNQNL